LLILLAADPEKSVADEADDARADSVLAQSPLSEIALDSRAQRREIAGHLADAIVFAKLPFLDGAWMILVLLAAPRIESPHLDRRPRIGGDVHVAPRRRNPQRIDALQIALVFH